MWGRGDLILDKTHCWAQLVAYIWPPCCDMLLGDVLGVVGSSLKIVKFEPTTPNTSQHGGQTHATCCTQQCCDMLCWQFCCVRLARALISQTGAFLHHWHKWASANLMLASHPGLPAASYAAETGISLDCIGQWLDADIHLFIQLL